MRSLILVSISAVVLSGCLTTQENPNYEHSTVYRGGAAQTTQYATTAPATSTAATYETATSYETAASYETATTAYPVYAHPAPVQATTAITAPTDTAYASTDVTGTPGFMAMQGNVQTTEPAPALPAVQMVNTAPLGAAGTPIEYDYSRNLITADAVTTGQQYPETVRVMGGGSQNYTVQPGDTVYSLSRKTCVGVNVIQSMNGLGADYGIQIGQALRLPASVC